MDLDYFKKTFKLDSTSSEPRYKQISNYLKRMIQMGILKEGDQMIPEVTICNELNVSRSTVRLAMAELLDEGLLVRYRGKGSYVADNRMKRPINYLYNFTESMHDIGAQASSVVLNAEVLSKIPEEVREKLQLPKEQRKVFYLHRIRCGNNEPMLVEHTYIPYYLCNGIESYDFSSISLYYILDSLYGLEPYHATETIEAVNMTEDERKILRCQENIPAFRIKRISHTETGLIYEYTESTSRSDRNVFQLELYKNQTAGKNPVNIQRNFRRD